VSTAPTPHPPASAAGPRRRIALAWASATAALLLAIAAAPGISRVEGEAVAAAERPGVFAAVSTTAHALLAPAVGEARAWRVTTIAFAAFLSSVLALLGWDLAGVGGALLAPALFWVVPRHLHHGLAATGDLAEAALWLATALAWRRSLSARGRFGRGRWTAAAAILYGLAGAVRPDGWALLAVVAVHALVARPAAGAGDAPAGGVAARLRRIPPAVPAMALGGPLLAVVVSPGAWREPLLLFTRWPAAGPGPGAAATAALAIPAAILVAYAGGLLHTAGRVVRPPPGARREDEALLLLLAVTPLALSLAGPGRRSGGLEPLLPALPVLSLLAARALEACARTLLPARAPQALAALSVVALYPALRTSIHHFPNPASAWNELAGGAPGAASLGLPRQAGGEAAASVVAEVAAHARPGARIWWPGVAPEAVRAFARDGRLRTDLAVASGPAEADVVVAPLDGGSRDAEYAAWSALRTARPVASFAVDEVPLVFVYARSGGWR
jgi:hypothetical protein